MYSRQGCMGLGSTSDEGCELCSDDESRSSLVVLRLIFLPSPPPSNSVVQSSVGSAPCHSIAMITHLVRPRALRAVRLARFSTERPDPMAKRPNKLCDPYGQQGKPLARIEAESLKATVHEDWKMMDGEGECPAAITREFRHADFRSGAAFLQHLASTCVIQDHYAALTLDRKIMKKNWVVVSQVRCHTLVLGGLSSHDFFLAMVRE